MGWGGSFRWGTTRRKAWNRGTTSGANSSDQGHPERLNVNRKMRKLMRLLFTLLTRYLGLVCLCVHTQSCLTLHGCMDCSPSGSSVHGIFQTTILQVLVAQSHPTLWGPMNCSPSGSCAHGILQARILEWVAISYSRGSSRPKIFPRLLCLLHCR